MPPDLSIGDDFDLDRVIGIDPRVDYACKRVLGDPSATDITVHFLNAVLRPKRPITSVTIQNPLTGREVIDDRDCMLDVLAHDATGSAYNVEIQTDVRPGLADRLTYYAAKILVAQLAAGDAFRLIEPVASICVLDGTLLRRPERLHHAFALRDDDHQTLTHSFQIHVIQLPFMGPIGDDDVITDPIEQWAAFFKYAAQWTPRQLLHHLPDPIFQKAAEILMTIANKTQDRIAYDAREKGRLDAIWRQEAAKFEGHEEGLREGREVGLQEGRQQGQQEGILIGEIRILQSVLKLPVSDIESLTNLSLQDLQTLRTDLQQNLA